MECLLVLGCIYCWIYLFELNYSKLSFTFSCRNIEEDDSADAEVSGGDHKSAGESSSVGKEVSVDVKL